MTPEAMTLIFKELKVTKQIHYVTQRNILNYS